MPAVRTLINCEGGQRLSHAYLSESSVVDVEFFVSRNQLKNQLYFLLHYVGKFLTYNLPDVYVGARWLDDLNHFKLSRYGDFSSFLFFSVL